MIKVYLDWNVMSGMRNGQFNSLKKIIVNKEKFLLVYSTSHIGDISQSVKTHSQEEQEMIRTDLDYIRKLTDNLCLYNDSKHINIQRVDPGKLLDDRIEQLPLFDDLSLESIAKIFEEDPTANRLMTPIFKILESMPLDSILKEAFENPQSAEMMEKMFPGLKENMTMGGFFKSFGQTIKNLNDTEDYKDLRNMVQKIGINSGHFNPDKDPFKLIDDTYKKLGVDSSQVFNSFNDSKNAPEWFNKLTNEYIKLDMHGFKQDKVKVSQVEKNTFGNTTEDAFHTSFASLCEFYITNDTRDYEKAKAVYNEFGISTKVLKPHEFIEYYNRFLMDVTIVDHFKRVIEVMKRKEMFQEQKFTDGRLFGSVCFTYEYFFNYFNKIMIPANPEINEALFILSKENPSEEAYLIAFEEIEGLVKLLVDSLGIDENGKSFLEVEEFIDEGVWIGRRWDTNLGLITLVRSNSWFQLYLFMNKEEDEKTISKV